METRSVCPIGNNSGVGSRKNWFSTEISLLLKFGSSLQYNRKLVSYGTLWIAHKRVKSIKK